MGKIKETFFGDFYYNKFSKPFRKKKDFIFLILDTLRAIYIDAIKENKRGDIVIKIDKMSRIFYFFDDKYFSIVFPFCLEEKDEKGSDLSIYDNILELEIDNRMISLLQNMLEEIDFENTGIEEMIDKMYFDKDEEGYDYVEIENCWKIILRLFSMELGYIRYDYDIVHENGPAHPLNHLDVNYSDKGTYKLGLKEKIKKNEFIDLLDITTDCNYLV